MFQFQATGHPVRQDFETLVVDPDCAEVIMRRMLEQGYDEFYISPAVRKPGDRVIALSDVANGAIEDTEITKVETTALNRSKHKAICISMGERLHHLINWAADRTNMSNNAYMVRALERALDRGLRHYKMSLEDHGTATEKASSCTIRVPEGMEILIQEQADAIGVSRSAWCAWGIMATVADDMQVRGD